MGNVFIHNDSRGILCYSDNRGETMKKQTRDDIGLICFGLFVFVLFYLMGIYLAGVNILAPGNEFHLLVSMASFFGPLYVIITERLKH